METKKDPNPERFKTGFDELEDHTGFKLEGCDFVFRYDEADGWYLLPSQIESITILGTMSSEITLTKMAFLRQLQLKVAIIESNSFELKSQ